MHVWALHIAGSNNPLGIEPRSDKDTLPFHPYYTVKDAFGLVMFLLVYAFFVFYYPNYLGHTDNYIPADPLVTPAHIVPEWYFLPFYAILRSVGSFWFIPAKLIGVAAMGGAVMILFLLPWLDTSPIRSARFRPIFRQVFWVFVIDVIILGYCGANPPGGLWTIVGKIATAYYFLHFLVILPLVGFLEKPLPLPASIGEAVLRNPQIADRVAHEA